MEDRAERDQGLVQAVLAGDDPAFEELVQRYQKLVASVAWRYGVQRSDIEDVVSEVFLKVYTKLNRYSPEHSFSTWLYRVAANHVVDVGRRARREQGRSEMPDEVVDPSPGPGAAAETLECAQRVRAALARVAPHYREALFLVYLEGFRVDEAARELGLPVGTVKSRLLRGRRALRAIFESEDGPPA